MEGSLTEKGVIYFLTSCSDVQPKEAPSHALLLVVSLWSLRKHYSGRVAILATHELSAWVKSQILEGPELGRGSFVWGVDLVQMRRNSAHVTKTALHRSTPFDVSIFIDADTLPVADPSPLFDLCTPEKPLVLTHFAGWTVGKEKGVVRKRIKTFADAAGRLDLFEQCVGSEAINTGVYAFRKTSTLLEPAFELCKRGFNKFIPDECAWQLLFKHHPHVMLEDEYNYSPLYSKGTPKIWHAHGSKVLAPRIKDAWLGALREVWEGNVGNVRKWLPERDRKTYVELLK